METPFGSSFCLLSVWLAKCQPWRAESSRFPIIEQPRAHGMSQARGSDAGSASILLAQAGMLPACHNGPGCSCQTLNTHRAVVSVIE